MNLALSYLGLAIGLCLAALLLRMAWAIWTYKPKRKGKATGERAMAFGFSSRKGGRGYDLIKGELATKRRLDMPPPPKQH